ncbi:hypothetical protein [Ciceribacter ferrooxidans]|uniref:Uncharacterized protein n=1 Tax=Ciceribacter ferrooxidans TaxID=2509717 RepID=A0A4Q2RUP1_9HYPH|nr:hypothetical protein [Ciceribacter ferrooxidans]RYB92861.1 hypothetical protein EUU22_24985 [Ciceribacter ferrooxidans]
MQRLIPFVLVNLATGFLIGVAVGVFVVLRAGMLPGGDFTTDPLGVVLLLYAFGAPFSLGYLSTALFLGDRD